jgi:hypothetical protein
MTARFEGFLSTQQGAGRAVPGGDAEACFRSDEFGEMAAVLAGRAT